MGSSNDSHASILITCWSLASRTGSELHSLTLAKAFKAKGWDVTCFTLVHGQPLQGEFALLGVPVIDLMHLDQLSGSFDVLYAQHRPLGEIVWNIPSVTFRKVFIGVLGVGSAVPLEQLPHFSKQAHGLVFVSEEARAAALQDAGGDLESPNCLVFPNYATKEFFDCKMRSCPSIPKRIAVISNHPAAELVELKRSRSSEFSIDFIGLGTTTDGRGSTSVDITPEFLSNYDLVISIGRTAQHCFAASIPYYCYDGNGGPGYIDPDRAAHHAWYNFSGRSNPVKRTSEELYEDIVSGYEQAVCNLLALNHLARSKYDFDMLFEKLCDFIKDSDNSRDLTDSPRDIDFDELKSSLSVGLEHYAAEQPLYGKALVFFTQNDGSTANDIPELISYRYSTSITLDFSALYPNRGKVIRFVPDQLPCECTLDECEVVSTNALASHLSNIGVYSFLTTTPYFEIEPTDHLTFSARPLPYGEVMEKINAEVANALAPREFSIRESAKLLAIALKRRFLKTFFRA